MNFLIYNVYHHKFKVRLALSQIKPWNRELSTFQVVQKMYH